MKSLKQAVIAAGMLAAAFTGSASATPVKEFYESTTERERSSAIVMAITTQAYRHATLGNNGVASCIMKNFVTSSSATGKSQVPTALVSLIGDIEENKDRTDRHIEGYIVSYIDHYCPAAEEDSSP